ncbi:MAG: hypothetical protein U5K43_14355 [Halofilum sp. (in: g-proteobacteria)]|nr:hypothetical protein [Halofilum sp. (in: g-proteobacteria)]
MGSDGFYEALLRVYRRLAPHNLVTVVRYNRFSKPNFLFHHDYFEELAEAYLDRFYELDPFHHYWRRYEQPGIVALSDFPAAELKRSRYIWEFLQKSRIYDELGMLLPPVARSTVAMFLEQRRHSPSPLRDRAHPALRPGARGPARRPRQLHVREPGQQRGRARDRPERADGDRRCLRRHGVRQRGLARARRHGSGGPPRDRGARVRRRASRRHHRRARAAPRGARPGVLPGARRLALSRRDDRRRATPRPAGAQVFAQLEAQAQPARARHHRAASCTATADRLDRPRSSRSSAPAPSRTIVAGSTPSWSVCRPSASSSSPTSSASRARASRRSRRVPGAHTRT